MKKWQIALTTAVTCMIAATACAGSPGCGEAYQRLAHSALDLTVTLSWHHSPNGRHVGLRGMGPVTILPSLPAQADPGLGPLFPGAEVDPRTGRIRLPEFGVCILPTYPAQVAPGQDAALAPRLKTFRFGDGGPLFVEPEDETLFVPEELGEPDPD